MMVLSRIKLDTKNRTTMLALANPQKFHGAIESAFSGERKRNLWRIDSLGGNTYLLILSESQPDRMDSLEQYCAVGDVCETKVYDTLLDRITAGSRWRFRLTANPTISKKSTSDDERGKVMAHVTVAQQEQWLMDRAERGGFALLPDEFCVTKSQTFSFSKHGQKRSTLLSVTYDGILTVTDPEKFRATMVNGIGRGKAYGNGLLTVVRV